jgi:hypothetical protein
MALPVFGMLFGALGIEAAKDAAAVVDSALAALFGRRVSEVMEEVADRVRGYTGGVPTNHDLERTLRLLQLTSTLLILRAYEIADEADRFDQRGTAPSPFIKATHDWLRDQIGLCPRMTVRANETLVEEMERALDGLLRSGDPSVAARQRIAEVEAAAWAELAAGVPGLPADFRARFMGQTESIPGWRDVFRELVREALKERPRVKVAFDISRLAALRDESARMGAVLDALAGDAAALRGEMARVAAELHELRLLVDRLTRDLSLSEAEKRALVQDLACVRAEQQGTVALVAGFLETMVGRQVPPENFAATLFAISRDWRQAGERIDALATSRNLSPRAAALRDEAAAAHAAGHLDAARSALAAMAAEEQAALTRLEAHAEEIEAERRLRRSSLAETKGAQAGVEKAGLRYREAATLYREASGLVAFDPQAAWQWLMQAARALDDLGREFGDNDALRDAIALYGDVLALAPRDRVPLDWAATQNNLGTALWKLGARESGTARLEKAVTAYRLALQEWTRDRVPLDWATTQNNLGIALQTLGARESGTARLEEAVAAYRLALQERTRDRVPLNWATTQNNLGIALQTLGERESGTARLEEAVAAYRLALQEQTRDRVPLDWAMTQNNLGNALATLGARESGTARLEEAVVAYRLALQERTRDRVPLDWAMTQNNLGNALATLGARESGTARLEEAVAAYRLALEEWTRDRVPLDWAGTQNNLGNALQRLGARESGTARLEQAVAAYRLALQERTRERVPLDWAGTQNNLGTALRTLGARESGTARLDEAVAAYRLALEERTRDRAPYDWAQSMENLGWAKASLGEREAPRDHWSAALHHVEEALEEYRRAGADYDINRATTLRARLLARLAALSD